MDGLYQQSPPYSYLTQQPNPNIDNYHHMYRSNNSFQQHPSMDNNNTSNSHHSNNWSSHHPPAYNYYNTNNSNNNTNNNSNAISSPRPKITTNIWEDEGTLCFQVDAKGICVARRQDNDMINGTKLLNVVGMSRGKRDGILKNEKGRVVVKVGAMHLKGVWIPFSRATELAEKFKILDVLYPLFVEEPSVYLCNSIANGAHNSDVIPSVTNKCNMVSSPLPAFNRQSASDEYSPSIPNWDNRPSYLMNTSPSHYDHGLNRNHHHHQHPHSSSDENDMYLLNNNQFHHHHHNNHHHNNRGSFSSVSSHQSYLYPSLPQQHEDDTSKASSVTTPTSFVDQIYHHTTYGPSRSFQDKSIYTNTSSPYIKSSPYTSNATTNTTTNTTSNSTAPAATADHRNSSAGSTTPSSWFSPETPTAVLFQKEEVGSKRRKTSTSSLDSKSIQKSSPIDRVTRRLKIEKD